MKKLLLLGALLCAFLLSPPVHAQTTGDLKIIDQLKKILTGPIPVTGAVGMTGSGAAHEANSQVTAGTSAVTLAIARPTRLGLFVRNLDASLTVYIGGSGVTTSNGTPLKPGEGIPVTAVTLWQVITASGSPKVSVIDEYN